MDEAGIMKYVLALLCFANLSLPFLAFANGPAIKLDLTACRAAPANIMTSSTGMSGPHSEAYKPYLIVCPVVGPNGSEVLQVLALRADLAFADHKLYFIHGKPWDGVDGSALIDADPVPKPAILTPTGKHIGTLQDFLFSEGAGTPTVTFVDWHNNLPQRILFRMDDAGVVGSYCPPPLVWSTKMGRYVEQPGSRTQACHGQ